MSSMWLLPPPSSVAACTITFITFMDELRADCSRTSLASQLLHTRGRVWSTENTRLVIADSATME